MPRVLVVDGSRLMAWLVQTLASDDVEVVQAGRLADAHALLVDDPPDAAIFNLTPWDLEWSRLIDLCHDHAPPIPFVLCSTLDDELPAGLQLSRPPVAVIKKPARISELRAAVFDLLRAAERSDLGQTSD
ncbi:MAG TPA: response regulator [Thermoanaerobaculales bacterium]|nr:response regulator [Thermoanaerobaculales bacterium]HPA82186.1 response regulator [Thermoanaerobaculales bacterium]HQL30645.1 response regulator [Thermoanaerobaculales bacterium]HQN95215.1 response regulator [Thermoanaerobaculales bacterium]HQP42117.1 response regulator [Thermoanaerobaculales bacterium]